MENDTFQIKTVGFEGPFALLLNLVEKRKLFINDVSLAQVTEDYITYMNKLGDLTTENYFRPGEVSSFILVASTLLLIKSKSLIPNLNLTLEEEGDIHKLEERLRLYEQFMKLSINVKNNFGKRIIFAPLERKNNILIFLPDDQITKESMITFARNVLDTMPKKVSLTRVEVKKVISLEEMIEKLTDRIKSSLTMNFKDFHPSNSSGRVETKEEKIVVIVGFLAMLELIRQGIINAIQEIDKGDIIITKEEKNLELEILN